MQPFVKQSISTISKALPQPRSNSAANNTADNTTDRSTNRTTDTGTYSGTGLGQKEGRQLHRRFDETNGLARIHDKLSRELTGICVSFRL